MKLAREQPTDAAGLSSSGGVMRNSLAGGVWTVVSRLTGLGKAVAVGAVLGATYLGNTYQAINALPNLVYYQLLAGSLFASLLVPPLIGHLDEGDQRSARRLAQGFLGFLLVVTAAVSLILVAIGPMVVRLLMLGVSDPATATAQHRIGVLLLVMFVPQISLYVIAGTGAAVMNAHGRFALAAAAPSLESVGIILVLVTAGAVFATDADVSNQQLLLLGLGTTSAVALHAACQWLGARFSGLTLLVRAGWRDPEVRRIIGRVVPTLAFTGLAAVQIFATMVVANRLPGGIVAFQLALNFFYLPTAIVTWPIARALLPQLSRLHHGGDDRRFNEELLRSVAAASFVTVPAALAYVALSFPLAHAVAFGQLDWGGGWELMALSLASLALGIVGETWFTLGTYAFYARQDVRSPVRSMVLRVGVSLCLMVVAWMARGPAVLVLLGSSLTVGSLAGAAHVGWRLRGGLRRTDFRLAPSLGRTFAASAIMAIFAYLTSRMLHPFSTTRLGELVVLSAAALVGAAVYFGVQTWWRAPELSWLRSGLTRRRPASGLRR
jgi:putative peptidoglycan lipid II flippase